MNYFLQVVRRFLERIFRFLRKLVLEQLSIVAAIAPTSGLAGTVASIAVTALDANNAPLPDGTAVSVLGTASDKTTTVNLNGTTIKGVATIPWTAIVPAGLWTFVPTVNGENGSAATFNRSETAYDLRISFSL